MSDILTVFGQRIKLLRLKNNLTQEQLAQKSGLHKNYIGMIERGERNPSLKNIETIANTFGMTISNLMKL